MVKFVIGMFLGLAATVEVKAAEKRWKRNRHKILQYMIWISLFRLK